MSYGAYRFHGTRKKRGLVVTYLLIGLSVIGSAQQCKETDKITVRISGTLTIGKELKLQCRRAMSGTPRWEKERSLLTFNLRVENFYKHKIDLEPTKNKYDITIKNATWGDINATYTCHVGYDCKQIRPVEFYTVLPSNEIKSIKESVYNNGVLNGSLVFQHVYPLPECVLFSNGIRLLVLRICNTCSIWKMFFFKVEFHFTVKLNNTNLSGCNNTVKCSIGDKEYTYIFPTENADQATNEKDKFGVGWIIFIVVVIIIVSGVTILILCWLHSYFKRDTNRTQDYETVQQPPIYGQ